MPQSEPDQSPAEPASAVEAVITATAVATHPDDAETGELAGDEE